MRNKFKITALVVAVIVGMVLYKNHFDKREQEEKDAEDKKKSARAEEKNRWN